MDDGGGRGAPAVERLTTEFVATWEYRDRTYFYYDWLISDFFYWLRRQTDRWLPLLGSSDHLGSGEE